MCLLIFQIKIMSKRSLVISAEAFFQGNPLWKLLKLNDGGNISAAYKSRNNEYIMECKICGEQAERRGTAGFKCLRCRRNVEYVDGEFEIVEPTDQKELDFQTKGMARQPKVFFTEEEDSEESEEEEAPKPAPKPVSSKKKTTSRKKVESSSDTEEEEPEKIGLSFADLGKIASKVSGNLTQAEIDEQAAIIKAKNTRRAAKKAADEEDISVDITASILPEKKKKERSKKADCSGPIKKEIVVPVMKAGEMWYCAELEVMLRFE